MNRIVTTKPIVGICHMQVCAESDVTDEEILAHCNRDNPAGTIHGWSSVIRMQPEGFWGEQADLSPRPCAEHLGRTHFLVQC